MKEKLAGRCPSGGLHGFCTDLYSVRFRFIPFLSEGGKIEL